MKKIIMFTAAVALLTSCMSDNKAWLRAKELELKAERSTKSTTTVEGPAEMKLEQGGKMTFEAGK